MIPEEEKFVSNWLEPATKIFESNWFKLLEHKDYHFIQYHSPQVIVLPIVEENSIVLPRVRRKILGHAVWELPAGGALPNESSREAALRELKEETGIDIRETNRLKTERSLVVSPNRLPMFPHIFSVQITEQEYEERIPHDDEVESLGRFSVNELKTMIINGEIITSITISILSRFLLGQRK